MAEYKPPIEIIQTLQKSESAEKLDEYVISTVWEYGVNVDKEELLKALQYDRNQYFKGYNDAKAEIVHCSECKYWNTDEYLYQSAWLPCMSVETSGDYFCADGERKE